MLQMKCLVNDNNLEKRKERKMKRKKKKKKTRIENMKMKEI